MLKIIFLIFSVWAADPRPMVMGKKAPDIKLDDKVSAAIDNSKLRYELLSKLLESSSASLKGGEFCSSFVQNKQGTVGNFIAWSLANYEKGVDNSINAECSEGSCSVNFAADSKGESPWSCGLQFKYDKKKKKIDPKTFKCTGTC